MHRHISPLIPSLSTRCEDASAKQKDTGCSIHRARVSVSVSILHIFKCTANTLDTKRDLTGFKKRTLIERQEVGRVKNESTVSTIVSVFTATVQDNCLFYLYRSFSSSHAQCEVWEEE